ncbi:MAG: hypothetical protein EXX96DRAFT_573940 [Benjaminiella poitrasii]|nr:MAG: hypothetical protein EXX96DRAFT_573940 [Benjaminiella poitrasii]
MKPENYDDIPFYASTQKHNERIKQLLLPTTVKKPSPPKPLPTPPRRHLLHTPVFQVVNANTVKDRYLFLFSDLLLICKPIMDENIIVSNPDNNRYRFRPNQSSLFQVKNIVQLGHLTLYVSKEDVYNQQIQKEQELYPTVQLDKDGRPILPPARKIHPILASALRKFEVNPQLGIQYLIDKRILTDDPLSIANFLFKTPDLNRRQLGYYLAMTTSREIYDAFLECFRLVGLRLDEALRILLTTFRLPSQWESLEYLIERFAKKWHDANQNVIKFHEDMVVKVVVAMLFLNAEYWYDASSERDVFWYAREVKERQDGDQQRRGRMGTLPSSTTTAKGSVANAPLHYIMSMRASGQTTKPTLVEFLDRWNYYDQYRLVPREFMEEMYKSIVDERLETGWDNKKSTTITTSTTSTTTVAQQHDVVITVIPHRLPSRLTKGIPSSPITITIPKPDKGLQIKLRGQDLVFEPNVLDFSTSCIQTFRMTGFTLGRTSLMLIKTGENASKYVSPTLPRTKSVVVERPFMRYTFQIGFPPQQDVKKWMVEQKVIEKKSQQQQKQQQRKYTFSVETEAERQEWVEMLKRLSGHVNEERNETSLETLEKMSSEARVALQVLKEVLLADEVKKGTSLPPGGEKESGTTSSVHERTMRLLLPTKKKEDRKSLMTTTTNVVTKRGHEIVKLVVQNSMVPLVLGFLKSQIPNH